MPTFLLGKGCSCESAPFLSNERYIQESSWLKAELNPSLVPEVALVVVAPRKIVAKASQQIIKLCWPYGEVFAQRNVDASADNKIKGVVAGRRADGCAAGAGPVNISVEIAVSSPEQGLDKWFEMRSAEFNDWAHIVGKQ